MLWYIWYIAWYHFAEFKDFVCNCTKSMVHTNYWGECGPMDNVFIDKNKFFKAKMHEAKKFPCTLN